MRLGGRLQAAIEILGDFERSGRPVADILTDWGAAHRFAGSGDRAAIGNFVHDALRSRRSASAMLGHDTPRAAVMGACLRAHRWTPDDLDQQLEGDRFAPPPLSADERASFATFDPEAVPAAVRADIPDWCVEELSRGFGADWPLEGQALALRPPLDLRVNRLKASREQVLEALAKYDTTPTALSPDGVRIPPVTGHGRHPNLSATDAFRNGWFEMQDEGSQLAALLAATGRPRQVLDYCAGAGGKTLSLSALMENRGQILAHDADRRRLRPIRERLQRAGCRNVQVIEQAEALKTLAGRMDLVLADAPCTGSGTWRRRADSKWRLNPGQLAARTAEQDAVLTEAARFVRPGGRLAYVTCSLFPCENEDRVRFFLERHDGFALADPARLLRDAGLAPDRVIARDGGIVLTPRLSGTDGFFITVLVRNF